VAEAAQLVAQPPQRVVAREAVRAIAGDGQHRDIDERREQLERRLVRPLQVVEEQDRRPRGREVGEGAAHGFRHGGGVAGCGRLAELGQQQREVGEQRAVAGQAVGVAAKIRAQSGDDRRVWRGAGACGMAAQHLGVGSLGQRLRKPRLADSGLAGQQDERPAAEARTIERGFELGELSLPADERASVGHRASLSSGRDGVRTDDDGVGDRRDLVGGHADPLRVRTDRLGTVGLVDAHGPEIAVVLADDIAADPADARAGLVALGGRALGGGAEIVGGRPAVAAADGVELHGVSLVGHGTPTVRAPGTAYISRTTVFSARAGTV
jgi:hypothetical protein